MMRATSLCALVGVAAGHSSMIMPPARNSIDAELPQYSGGKHPPTGWIDAKRAPCTNGTTTCNSGQSTFWFSQVRAITLLSNRHCVPAWAGTLAKRWGGVRRRTGTLANVGAAFRGQGCTIGCKACDGIGARLANYDHCPGESIKPTLLPKYRTANRHATPGSELDVFKYNPWRAPGRAPTFDACGMAGGGPVPTTAAAEYNPTKFAKQGDHGTKVLKPRPSGTVWRRGSVAYARQQSTAPHGGGYIYRLCPANETITEECFNRMPLEFATPEKHMLRFKDPSLDREVKATLVTEGGGTGWMVYPWPSGKCPGGVCDGALMYKVGPGKHCKSPRYEHTLSRVAQVSLIVEGPQATTPTALATTAWATHPSRASPTAPAPALRTTSRTAPAPAAT